ncbi:uncharacterized membrane protein YcaP (DUF421 family) [Anaerosolibacter carboniphilus]|uniref:Uncharacterized membrane protein YcaP (DUF421 family) n=1 Tax=Anaerosolibacter carboniphilus TaxID=1417629 RepID=A0A841KX37_9FIRM|nr:DUF421 domain-containing protein [Anaerosolibacter carboniphilus]MBB6214749.1 uncharacterized membrane protein YcaP (DUF421 family) [Anaerosolibacter carboniphilus]
MHSIFVTVFRTLLGFTVLFLLTRMLGKKQIGQLTHFTYITGIALGNIVGDMVVHRDIKLMDGLVGVTLWAVLTFLLEYLSLKSSKARVLLDGEPMIVIKKGKIQEKALSKSKLNIDDLSMLLRNKEVFSFSDVDYAILETNGKLSVLKIPESESPTRKDLKILTHQRVHIPSEIIVDGKVVIGNLEEFSLSQAWLDNQLKLFGIESVSDVIYAELQSDGRLYINKRKERNS